MIEIEVQKIPNQEFTKTIDGVSYTIKLRTFKEITLIDLAINNKWVMRGFKICPNTLIIPYDYLIQGGNFIFYCLNNEYPIYTNFGETQQLLFLTDKEIRELRNESAKT